AELYSRKVINLQNLLSDETTRPRAMETIRSMIERIEVSKGDERGRPSVVLVGALAAILDYVVGSTQQKAAVFGGGFCRVLRWSPFGGQVGGFAKLGSGLLHAASSMQAAIVWTSAGVRPPKAVWGREPL
ncbi:MAG: hypothetical protein ACK55A_03755, partial [Gemmatimonas sp.]